VDNAIAIITARGGSKRIPRKNIRDFLGQPIIRYSIDAALKAGIFAEVMVSTDDEEIAAVAQTAGASVPFRRSLENSDDYATTADVINEVITEYQKLNRHFAYLCCIYPTAPFVTAAKLKDSLTLLKETAADALVPVCNFSYPIQRAYCIENGRLKRMWPEYEASRSQDLAPACHDAGQFYWHRAESFLHRQNNKDYVTIPFPLSELEVQDLDTELDWQLAELKYRLLQGSQNSPLDISGV